MYRIAIVLFSIAGWASAGFAAQTDAPAPLTADQIVEKNAAARGGLEAWRKCSDDGLDRAS